jgi:ferredoxin-NADP reductase
MPAFAAEAEGPRTSELRRLTIREVLPASSRNRIVRIDLDGQVFPFRAGQALKLGNHLHDTRRAYSIAVSPADVERHGVLEVLVGVDDQGWPGAHLTLEAGVAVDVEGPIGGFTCPLGVGLPDDIDHERLVLVAGGTGIAPLRALLRHGLAARKSIRLVYSARTQDDFAYAEELSDLARTGLIELRQTVTRGAAEDGWTGRRGRVAAADLSVSDPRSALYVLCGPMPMVCGLHDLLQVSGVPADRILVERWCRQHMAPAASIA